MVKVQLQKLLPLKSLGLVTKVTPSLGITQVQQDQVLLTRQHSCLLFHLNNVKDVILYFIFGYCLLALFWLYFNNEIHYRYFLMLVFQQEHWRKLRAGSDGSYRHMFIKSPYGLFFRGKLFKKSGIFRKGRVCWVNNDFAHCFKAKSGNALNSHILLRARGIYGTENLPFYIHLMSSTVNF